MLNYGCFDLSGFLPAAHHFDLPLVLDLEIMQHFTAAYLPDKSEAEKRNSKVSPLYADFFKVKAPPALFVVGTLDPLLDDTVFMATKWGVSGAEAVLKVYPGEPARPFFTHYSWWTACAVWSMCVMAANKG